MSEHKRAAMIEAVVGTAVGFILGYLATLIIPPLLFDSHISPADSFWWTVIMTIISLLRGYYVRLFFSRRRINSNGKSN